MINYARCNQSWISQSALVVLVGVLESLVEAIPTHIGHTHLQSLQCTLYSIGWEGNLLTFPILLLLLVKTL